MSAQKLAPITPAQLRRVRWRGERAYRILSLSFSVRWNREPLADRIEYAFGAFGIPSPEDARKDFASPNGSATFSLVDLGPRHTRRYRLLLGDGELISGHSSDDIVNHLLWQILKRMRETEEFLLIHAGSLVTSRGEGVLLPADSGSGKTTLVAGLLHAGFKFLSDEVGVIDWKTGLLHPYPRALNFKEGSLGLFPALPPPSEPSPLALGQRYLRADDIWPDVMANACRLRFVIAPRYVNGAATMVTPLSPAATVKELWANVMNLPPDGSRALPLLAKVVRQVRGYRLISGDLEEAVQAVARVTGLLSVLSD